MLKAQGVCKNPTPFLIAEMLALFKHKNKLSVFVIITNVLRDF